MPGQLRSRLRRVLTGEEGHSGPLGKFKSRNHKQPLPESDFYLPGEKMPPLKYRRPVDPEHKKRLEAFSFSTAWRRHSNASLYSPMGSRLPSRRSSFRSRRSRSRSMHRSRRSSVSSEYDHEEWVDSGIGASIAGDDRPANIREASDDEGDVLNEDPRDARRKQSAGARRSSSVRQSSRPGTGSDRTRQASVSVPFSPEELELALQKSHLEATKEETDRSAGITPCEDFDDFADPSPFLRPRGGSIYVPYDGQGTPPKLPFWGTAYPSNDDAPSAGHFSRRPSVFVTDDGDDDDDDDDDLCCTPQYERRESAFFPVDAPGLTQARRSSVFVAVEQTCECPPAKALPQRKPQPCAPCDAIAAILARPD
ncbi:hypothetical protein T440DRAFT_252500 [Plenodomus tracheiphilus IPT5]|uniref:Uncharacterized protein n=1 Tax=Plenodomus tracheiphilus IPT5 TaxID=1408161 RepID=A0A6A7AS56_9PLEO|nr:hypothetical protein T440DRAFT_252500 [Plenodomus tracheiphilus IPT5]